MTSLSFNNVVDGIPILPGGTPACMGNPSPYGSFGKIVRQVTIAQIRSEGWGVDGQENEVLYWFEYADGRPSEYIWRSNLYPAFAEE